MKTKISFISLFIIMTFITACKSYDNVQIRVKNDSEVAIKKILVYFSPQPENYGDLAPGQSSKFKKVTGAYAYAYITAEIEGREAIIHPEDYVGESSLKSGNYTYLLDYNISAHNKYDRLELKLKNEK